MHKYDTVMLRLKRQALTMSLPWLMLAKGYHESAEFPGWGWCPHFLYTPRGVHHLTTHHGSTLQSALRQLFSWSRSRSPSLWRSFFLTIIWFIADWCLICHYPPQKCGLFPSHMTLTLFKNIWSWKIDLAVSSNTWCYCQTGSMLTDLTTVFHRYKRWQILICWLLPSLVWQLTVEDW